MKTEQTMIDFEKHSVVLICHQNDPLDAEGIAAWLSNSFCLAGIVLLQDRPDSILRKIRKEYRRVGFIRLLDVIMFRLMYQFIHARNDTKWVQQKVRDLQLRYPANIRYVPRLYTHDPNSEEVHLFVKSLNTDFALARCKHILKEKIFTLPRYGTYVLHPGICPAYRNAHGCFWALVNRDLGSVGMTLLKVDSGIDTGPVYLQSSYSYDESLESHIIIQYRVVLENLDLIVEALTGIFNDTLQPCRVSARHSMNWGQPWLSAWIHWQRKIRGPIS